jgi:tetratricopeptide (TPR) repeat protein
MSKTLAAAIALAVLGIFLLSGCGGPGIKSQVEFGVWAAENELWEEAIFRWKKVLAQNPQSLAAHNNLAVAYEKRGLWDEARKEYEAALKLAPDNSWVKRNFKKFEENFQAGPPGPEAKAAPNEKK